MKKLTLLFFIIGALALQGIAQKVTNVSATQQDKKVIVSYKVEGSVPDCFYIPSLYYSTDGGGNYKKCNSTYANNAIPDQAAQITWNVTNDLDYFGGNNIVFKVFAYPQYVIDGKYKTKKFGTQVWLVENLNIDVGDGCFCYDDKQENCNKYGRLYTWEAAKRASDEIVGWHLPTDAEWKQLERYLGMSKSDADEGALRGDIGNKLKSTSGWNKVWKGSGNGNNSSGFCALPGGTSYYESNGDITFCNIGEESTFWSSTLTSNSRWTRSLYYKHSEMGRWSSSMSYGKSVRLVKD